MSKLPKKLIKNDSHIVFRFTKCNIVFTYMHKTKTQETRSSPVKGFVRFYNVKIFVADLICSRRLFYIIGCSALKFFFHKFDLVRPYGLKV